MATYGYVRVSTKGQVTDGMGLADQVAAIRERFGPIPDCDIFRDEGKSGGDRERNGIMTALATLERGDVLAIAYSSRLARDADFAAWVRVEAEKRGAVIRCADGREEEGEEESKTALILRWVGALVDELKKHETRVQTRRRMAEKRVAGEKTGGACCPYGYRIGGYREVERRGETVKLPLLEAVPAEQETIAQAREMRAAGMSLRHIGRTLGLGASAERVRRILGRAV